jgi:hypothetical protein
MWRPCLLEDVDQKHPKRLFRIDWFGIDTVEHSCIQVDKAAGWEFEVDGFELAAGFLVELPGEQSI